MNNPPDYEGGPPKDSDWGVVYRDETEPTMPEYICLFWQARGGQAFVTGGLNSFCPATAKPSDAVQKAIKKSKDFNYPAKDNIVWWGVIREH
jgi:hypothetical protein